MFSTLIASSWLSPRCHAAGAAAVARCTNAPATISFRACVCRKEPDDSAMPNTVVHFSEGRPSGLRRPTFASSMRQFALRNQMALALIFVLCGSAACLLTVEIKERYTNPVTLITRTRTTHTSFMSNIGNSFGGLIFGIILIPVSIAILVWNEFRAVRKWKSLVEVEHKCRQISPDSIQSALDGKLVHFNGALAAKPDDFKSVCRDAELNVSFPNALHVNRKVEMMQWKARKSTRRGRMGRWHQNRRKHSHTKRSGAALTSSLKVTTKTEQSLRIHQCASIRPRFKFQAFLAPSQFVLSISHALATIPLPCLLLIVLPCRQRFKLFCPTSANTKLITVNSFWPSIRSHLFAKSATTELPILLSSKVKKCPFSACRT